MMRAFVACAVLRINRIPEKLPGIRQPFLRSRLLVRLDSHAPTNSQDVKCPPVLCATNHRLLLIYKAKLKRLPLCYAWQLTLLVSPGVHSFVAPTPQQHQSFVPACCLYRLIET